VASYSVNPAGVAWAQQLIDGGQYVLDSDWGKVQPRASEQNAFLKSHSWEEYARWHLGLTDGREESLRRASVSHRIAAAGLQVFGDRNVGLAPCLERARKRVEK